MSVGDKEREAAEAGEEGAGISSVDLVPAKLARFDRRFTGLDIKLGKGQLKDMDSINSNEISGGGRMWWSSMHSNLASSPRAENTIEPARWQERKCSRIDKWRCKNEVKICVSLVEFSYLLD
jgi:hypothetical protein